LVAQEAVAGLFVKPQAQTRDIVGLPGGAGACFKRDLGISDRHDPPVSVWQGFDRADMLEIRAQNFAIAFGMRQHSAPVMRAWKAAICAGAIVVDRHDETHGVGDVPAVVAKLGNPACRRIRKRAVGLVARGLCQVKTIADAKDRISVMAGIGGVQKRLFRAVGDDLIVVTRNVVQPIAQVPPGDQKRAQLVWVEIHI